MTEQEPTSPEKLIEEPKHLNSLIENTHGIHGHLQEDETSKWIHDHLQEDEKNKWNTCGFIFDKNCLTFAITAIFSFTLIIFCITQLASKDLPNDKFTLYVSLLSGIINTWIPSPMFK